MSREFPQTFLQQLETRVTAAAGQRVARRFVPSYHSAAAIRVTPVSPERMMARRQLARLMVRRRTVS